MNKLFLLVLAIVLPLVNVYAQDEACPATLVGKDLTSWRKALLKKVLEGKYEEAQQNITKCFEDKAPACLGDMNYFIDSRLENIPDVSTFNDTADLAIKSAKDLPIELQTKVDGQIIDDQVSFPDNILEVAKAKGWKTVAYKTRSSGGFDNAPNLFMVAISTPSSDIFLQTSPHPDINVEETKNNPVPNPANGNIADAQNTLTVITVDKTKKPPVGQMRRLSKNGSGYQWSNDIRISDCIKCHSVPLKPITPLGYKVVNGDEQRMSREQEAQVEAMNYMLKQPVSWGTVKVGDKHKRLGPAQDSHPMGWAPQASETREDDFLKKCATLNTTYTYRGFGNYKVTVEQKNPSSINYRKVAEAMSCTDCHDNKNRGSLHERFSRNEIAFKILIDKSMPLNGTLSDDERLALYSCLLQEQSALGMKWRESGEWMTQASCFGDQFNGNPPKNYRPAGFKRAADTSSKNSKAIQQ